MNNKQTSLLLALAKKLDKKETSKNLVIKSLCSAGIVNKNGKITKKFPHLDRVLSVIE